MPSIPFIFLLVDDALSRVILKEKREANIEGFRVRGEEEVTHTLFVDDVLLFDVVTKENLKEFATLIEKYKKATRILVNIDKSMLVHNKCSTELIQ